MLAELDDQYWSKWGPSQGVPGNGCAEIDEITDSHRRGVPDDLTITGE